MAKGSKKVTCEQIRAMQFHFPLKKELEEEYYMYVEHTSECKECLNWELSRRIIERGGNPKEYCCSRLGEAVTYTCEQHPDPWDCADHVIVRVKSGNYGLPIRDGGSSYIEIGYCPWCGTKIGKDI